MRHRTYGGVRGRDCETPPTRLENKNNSSGQFVFFMRQCDEFPEVTNLMQKTKEVQFFISQDRKCYIKEWLKKLDVQTRARINVRLVRLEYGNYGDYKQIGNNLYELRFFFGKGYRIYFTEKGNKLILLLNAGDKDTQVKDIKKAREILEKIY